MKRLTDATLKKAEMLFSQSRDGRVLTGHGLSRRELRLMERAGLVTKQLMKHKETGQVIFAWTPVAVSEGIIKKA